jgi:hypothetical protein
MTKVSRRASLAAAKEAKMKKIAIGGGVVLLGLLGFQGPKVLHQLHGSSTASANTTPVDTSSVAAPVEQLPAKTLADVPPPQAGPGQLVSFDRFKSKDPFVQQLSGEPPASHKTTTPTAPSSTTPAVVPSPTPTTAPTTTTVTTPTPPAPAVTETAPAAPPPPAPVTTGTSTTTATPAPTSVSLATNGVCEVVEVKHTFPSAGPFFQLVSIAADGKSVQIGIAGGSLENGQPTVTVTTAKSVTLVDTASGIRYKLELLRSCPASTETTSTPTSAATSTTTTTTPTADPAPIEATP